MNETVVPAEFNSAFNWPEFNSVHEVIYSLPVTLRGDGAPVTLRTDGNQIILYGDGAPVKAQ